MEPKFYYFQHYPDERFIANLPWVKALKRRRAGLPSSLDTFTTCPNRTMHKLVSIDIDGRSTEETNAWKQVLEHATTQARVRAVQLHLDCISTLQALPVSFSCCGQKLLVAASAYYKGLHTDEIEREWVYDTGAAHCYIGYDSLTEEEKRRCWKIDPIRYVTGAGTVTLSLAVICNVPFLGPRLCHVSNEDSPPLISVKNEIHERGVIVKYSRESGPTATLADGTTVYLTGDNHHHCPVLSGYSKTESMQQSAKKRTETSPMLCAADLKRTSVGQAPWPGTEEHIIATVMPTTAAQHKDGEDTSWSIPLPPPHSNPRPSRSNCAQQQATSGKFTRQ